MVAWLRFATTRGINLDQCGEWTYEERVVPPPSVMRAGRQGEAKPPGQPPTGEPSPAVPALLAVESAPEPPVTVPALSLMMRGGQTIVLEGEDATKALAYLTALTGAL